MYRKVRLSLNERFDQRWTSPRLKSGKQIRVADVALSNEAALFARSGSEPA